MEESPSKETVDSSRLEALRGEIDAIDAELCALLERRFAVTEDIGKTKAKLGRNLVDQTRETIVLERVAARLKADSSRGFILNIFKSLMKESVEHQQQVLSENCELKPKPSPFPVVYAIGVGLVGGAMCRAIKSVFPRTLIHAMDPFEEQSAIRNSEIFESSESELNKEVIAQSSLIIISCPPVVSLRVLEEIAPLVGSGQIVIDMASVKQPICKLAEELNLNGAEFIGVHPFFGNEKKGFVNSSSVIVRGRNICLVPTSKSSSESVEKLTSWFSDMELSVFVTDACSHDQTVAMTSHILQLFSSALGAIIYDELISAGKEPQLVLSGGALASSARLMSSQSEMWRQITALNEVEISKTVAKLISLLGQLQSKEFADFEQVFDKAGRVRESLENR